MGDFEMGDFSILIQAWGREGPTPTEMVELSQRAERCGYHSVGLSWLTTLPASYGEGEGLLTGWPLIMEKHPGYCLDTLVVLPMIAQATSKIRVGFNAFVVPALHPFHVA